jgi:hypothetical protein
LEVLVPIVIVTIVIGLLLVFLRRPTVVRPPADISAPKPTSTPKSHDPMQAMLDDLNIDMSVGGKHVTLKGNMNTGWTLTDGLEKTTIPPEFLRRVVVRKGTDPLTNDLLAGLTRGSFPGDAPPEALLHYPGSSVVVDSFESKRTSGGAAESRAVYKTTLATEADSAQVQAWYRDWLLSHGWQVSPSAGTNSDSLQEFMRASEQFWLAVTDPATLTPILAMLIPEGTKTIYEVEYSNTSTHPPGTPAIGEG